MFLSLYGLFRCVDIYEFIYFMYLFLYSFVYLFTHLFAFYVFTYLFLFLHLRIYLFVYTPVMDRFNTTLCLLKSSLIRMFRLH